MATRFLSAIVVQSLATLLRYAPRADDRAVLHAVAKETGSDPLTALCDNRTRARIRKMMCGMVGKGLLARPGPGELVLTEAGWGRAAQKAPARTSARRFSVPSNLRELIAETIGRARHQPVMQAHLAIEVFEAAQRKVVSKQEVDLAVQAVRHAAGPNLQLLPPYRIRENLVVVPCPLSIPPTSFRDPVLRAMAAQTNNQPEYPLSKVTVLQEALRHMGLEPEPSKLRQLSGRVLRGLAVGSRRLVEPASPHLWVMTPDGARHVAPLLEGLAPALLRGEPPAEMNLTARWIRDHDAKGLRLECAKKIARKCPVSSRVGSIDDHVQQFFLRLIRRDALRKKIENREPIPYSLVASYAVRSAFVDFRNDGTEPVCREQNGARTEKEVRTLRARGENPQQVTSRRSQSSQTILASLADPLDQASSVEESIWFGQFWARFEGIIRDRFPTEAELYMKVLQARFEEDSVPTIAGRMGVNERRVRAILKNVGSLREEVLAD